MAVRQLKQNQARRQVYFGLAHNGPHEGLNDWIKFCNGIRKKPEIRVQNNLAELERIRYRLEIRQKFRDWHLVTVIRRKGRYLEKKRRFRDWLKLFLLSRYKILHAILSNIRPLIRYRFLQWKEQTLWLRAIDFYNLRMMKRSFEILKLNTILSKMQNVKLRFFRWVNMVMFLRKLKSITIFKRLLLRKAWNIWKERPQILPATMPPRDFSLLDRFLRSWLLNRLRKYFVKWRDTKDTPAPAAPPLDYNCICIAKICRGQHCDCRRDVHFKRRLQYCFMEIEAFQEDKARIREELIISKKMLKAKSSEDKKKILRQAQFAKRINAAASTAVDALKPNLSTKRTQGSIDITPMKKVAAYQSVGEVARRSSSKKQTITAVTRRRTNPKGISPPRSTVRSPFASPNKQETKNVTESHDESIRSHRGGLLHSLDGALSSHNRLRYSHHFVDEDISHWDLAHLQVKAPDLSQYQDLQL